MIFTSGNIDKMGNQLWQPQIQKEIRALQFLSNTQKRIGKDILEPQYIEKNEPAFSLFSKYSLLFIMKSVIW
jgi:hypothetical protein